MQINISTIDNKGKDIYLTWREFITDLLQPHNSIEELKRRDEDDNDNLPWPSYHINFKTIKVNENYKATQEDLKYFKKTFENILFDDNFIEIFNISKIKKFVSEIL